MTETDVFLPAKRDRIIYAHYRDDAKTRGRMRYEDLEDEINFWLWYRRMCQESDRRFNEMMRKREELENRKFPLLAFIFINIFFLCAVPFVMGKLHDQSEISTQQSSLVKKNIVEYNQYMKEKKLKNFDLEGINGKM